MMRLRILAARLRGLFGRGRRDRELAYEIESHLALGVEEGLTSHAAPKVGRERD